MSKKLRCPGCGLEFGNPTGRPTKDIDNEKVLETFLSMGRSVGQAAQSLGLPYGTVWSRLKSMGVLGKKGVD